jgi:hypothetical protein
MTPYFMIFVNLVAGMAAAVVAHTLQSAMLTVCGILFSAFNVTIGVRMAIRQEVRALRDSVK